MPYVRPALEFDRGSYYSLCDCNTRMEPEHGTRREWGLESRWLWFRCPKCGRITEPFKVTEKRTEPGFSPAWPWVAAA